MSRYIVRIVGPAGYVMYLRRGREVEREENATHYSSPSAANRAACNYSTGRRISTDIIDTRDPERQV